MKSEDKIIFENYTDRFERYSDRTDYYKQSLKQAREWNYGEPVLPGEIIIIGKNPANMSWNSAWVSSGALFKIEKVYFEKPNPYGFGSWRADSWRIGPYTKDGEKDPQDFVILNVGPDRPEFKQKQEHYQAHKELKQAVGDEDLLGIKDLFENL